MLDKKGIDRLITLFDAILAIVMTLLILPLADRIEDFEGRSFFDFFKGDNGLLFLSALISIVVLIHLWLSHHMIFKDLKFMSRRVFLIHTIFMILILIIPMFTRLMSLSLDNKVNQITYLLMITVIYIHLPIMEGHIKHKVSMNTVLPVVGMLIIILLATLFGTLSGYSLIMVLVMSLITMSLWKVDK